MGDVSGKSDKKRGIDNDEGVMTVGGNVFGNSDEHYGIQNYKGVITANNITGKNVSTSFYSGILNKYGTIEARGNISGTGVSSGIQNLAGIINVAGDMEGISQTSGIWNDGDSQIIVNGNLIGTCTSTTSGVGIDNVSGTIWVKNDIFGNGPGFGIANRSENNIITATNIYYCHSISNSGKITGTISCNCADSTQCGTVPTACLAPTPILSGDLTTCVSCATVDSTTPLWDAENQKCVACAEGTEWNGEVCSVPCPNDTPYWNGTECVACAMEDVSKPYWNGSSCEACSDGTVWNSTECISLKEYCTAKMSGYDSSTYTVSDDGVITYTGGDMTVASDLDVSNCDLVVSGSLTLNEGKTVKVKNVRVGTKSGGDYCSNTEGIYININAQLLATGNVNGCGSNHGIYNLGKLTGANMEVINGAVNYSGLYNEGEVILSGDITGLGSGYVILNKNTLTSKNVTATLRGGASRAIFNSGTMMIENEIIGETTSTMGSGNVGVENSGILTATKITGIGAVVEDTGISNTGEIIATMVKGEIKSDAISGPVYNPSVLTVYGAVHNSGTITADTVIGENPFESTNSNQIYVGLYNEATGKINATAVQYCPSIVAVGKTTGIMECNCSSTTLCTPKKTVCTDSSNPVLTSGVCVSCQIADSTKPYWDSANSVCVATCPNGFTANPLTNVCM